MSSADMDASRKMDNEFVRLFFFNVGHGASTLISMPPCAPNSGRRYGVVDCKEPAIFSLVESYLQSPPFKDEPPQHKESFILEFVALTHFDKDHFTGMARLLGSAGSPFTVRRFLGPPCTPIEVADTKYSPGSARHQELYAIHEVAYKPTRRARRLGKAPSLDVFLQNQPYGWFNDLEAMALAPMADRLTNEKKLSRGGNPSSGVLRLRFKTRHVLILGGDVEDDDWREIQLRLDENPPSDMMVHGGGTGYSETRRDKDLLKANIVGVPHHGGHGNSRGLWARFSRRMQKDARGKLRQQTEAIVSCEVDDPYPNRESYRGMLQTECSISCTNHSRFCSELFARRGSRAPCSRTGGTKTLIDPLGKFRCVDNATLDLENRLRPYAAPHLDAFNGSVGVTLREGQPPEVKHFGREACDLTLQILKEDKKSKNP